MAAIFRSLHMGGPLQLWDRCCLQSFADYRHEIVVFGYERFDVPPGVRWAPAQDIVSEAERDWFFEQAPGAYARFSDFFRYVLLERGGEWWVDTDVLCLSRQVPTEEIAIGWEDAKLVCGAIMHMPKGHELLRRAIDFCRENVHVDIRSHLGPHLLTRLTAECGLTRSLSEPSRFYPVHWSAAFELVDPGSGTLVENLVAASPFVHLWRGRFQGGGFQTDLMPPRGSFLGQAFARHGGAGVPELDGDAVMQQIKLMRRRNVLAQTVTRLEDELRSRRNAQGAD